MTTSAVAWHPADRHGSWGLTSDRSISTRQREWAKHGGFFETSRPDPSAILPLTKHISKDQRFKHNYPVETILVHTNTVTFIGWLWFNKTKNNTFSPHFRLFLFIQWIRLICSFKKKVTKKYVYKTLITAVNQIRSHTFERDSRYYSQWAH